MRFRFEIAQPSDDSALRRLLAETPMEGRLSLAFHREPNYFAANTVLGPGHETLVCRDLHRNKIVGLATRSVRGMYVGGEVQRIGYLSSLRYTPEVRRQGLLAHGFRFLREVHDADDSAPAFYLTTLAEDNAVALAQLTSGRAGLPRYHFLSRLHTLVLPIRRRWLKPPAPASARLAAGVGSPSSDEVLALLNQTGPQRSFFPEYAPFDFESSGTFAGLTSSDIAVIRRDDRIAGIAGLWDQRSFRQTVIHGYDFTTRCLRPFVNAWARLSGGIRLPPPGSALPSCFIAFPTVIDNDADVFRSLLRQLMRMSPNNAECLLLGLCDGDPLLPVARSLSRSAYTTRLYAVNWSDAPPDIAAASANPYYLELGCL